MYHEPRKNIRLHDFDYSSDGAYFITFCIKDRWGLLGEIRDENGEKKCVLSPIGDVVNNAINEIPKHYENMCVPYYIVMPNHVHLILIIKSTDKGRQDAVPTVIGHLKRAVSMKLGYSIWQPRFYDHVIRDRDDYIRIVEYMQNNPSTWSDDEYFTP